ncbi:MAG: hypothetical protein ACRECQ_09360 [Burkholderiaceae bacterium]
MADSKHKAGAKDEPTERELSQRQAMENAEAARDTHRSHIPGVADDSEVIQGAAAAAAAPIEGAADAMREDERARVRSKSPAAKVDNITGPRPADAPNVTEQDQRRKDPPTRPEDAEWDPLAATAEHRSDNKRTK